MLKAVYNSKPTIRIVSMMLAVALVFCLTGLFQQQSHAIVGELMVGGTAVLALAGVTLLALGLVFANDEAGQAALRSASQRLLDAACDGVEYIVDGTSAVATKIGELLTADAKKGKLVYFPPQNGYKWVAKLGDSTWQKAREWVNENYNPGENSSDKVEDLSSNFPSTSNYSVTKPGTYIVSGRSAAWDPFDFALYVKYEDGKFYAATRNHYGPYNYIVDINDLPSASWIEMSSAEIYRYGEWVQIYINGVYKNGQGDLTEYRSFTRTYSEESNCYAVPDVVDNPTYDFVNPTTGDRALAIPLAIPDASVDPDVVIPGVGEYSVDEPKYIQDLTLPDTTPEKVTEEPQTGVDMMPDETAYETPEDAPSWLQMLLDGLVSLVVPSAAQLQAWAVSMKEFCALHLGFLWQLFDILVSTIQGLIDMLSVGSISLADWSLTLPEIKYMDVVLLQRQTVKPFDGMTSSIWDNILTMIHMLGDAYIMYDLVAYGLKKYTKFFGNGGASE